jgi:hypothetical protein
VFIPQFASPAVVSQRDCGSCTASTALRFLGCVAKQHSNCNIQSITAPTHAPLTNNTNTQVL